MALGSFFRQPPKYVIEPVTGTDAAMMADLHREGFGRSWSDGEFASLLSQRTVFGFAARAEGRSRSAPIGFVLARLVAGEAEILTIAVARSARGKGIGRALMEAVLRYLHAERAEALFLEVDESNTWAVALYNRLGFREVAQRLAYYGSDGGKGGTALVMRRDLGRS